MMQLTFLEESREERLEREVAQFKKQLDQYRKSQYGKISEIKKLYTELYYDYQNLKRAICHGKEIF
jgi:uncharacterized membrane-anchored protein YhcB (DUF1043 family)